MRTSIKEIPKTLTKNYISLISQEFKGSNKNKPATLQPATLLKKRLQYRCFSLNSGKYLWTPIL